ncbi:ferredoxin [Rhodococcus sp. NPDC059968]|uniref:ferredoxin n=1 Tax=Rhodococcus TaxID=1827 RepID=UPI00366B1478
MKIALDTDKCMGHARCHAMAPAAFDLDDEGYAVVTPAAATTSEDDLQNAAASCPEQAITVTPS